ncbi:hypothetical protein GA830_10975 [Mesorhizobium sp. NBSH29]|uniref:hypothetical protein n=1 Tax=Mesorhizobium sp. NBSH29 TaxID=2654249 RepID=UPI0018968CAE|nr:hypothetical protein [Mesorhizobium sp. NBSH29]QPC87204.1 hypothetical protein GA830_10975 [Mesorhizobium sp. NBSH29]
MLHSKPLARSTALRALAEGARPTLAILAEVSGRSLRLLQRQAVTENWALRTMTRGDDGLRLRSLCALLLGHLEKLGHELLAGGKIDKAQIDGITAMVRNLEKVEEIMRPAEVAREDQVQEDEQMAGLLERVNERIIELAHDLAAQMVTEKSGAARSH